MSIAQHVWTVAPPIPGCFVVDIGDIVETRPRGRFRSARHRVANPGRERYPFPLIFGLDYGAKVEPLDKFRPRGRGDISAHESW
ncbi:isopenicillin N synthase family oxygenase [Maliponia aquimaris]|nr:isopenicillin N synthase family oxygenase [Maliponia aquimaris]